MANIEIRNPLANVLCISATPSLLSYVCCIGLCIIGLLGISLSDEYSWLSVAGALVLVSVALSELGGWEDVIADLGSGQLVTCHRGWHERLVTHTCQTSVTPLAQVSAVVLMRCSRAWPGWTGGRVTPCLRLRSGVPTPLFRRSFPAGQQAELRTLADQLTTFLGLSRLQSVAEEAGLPDFDLLTSDLDQVTSLESQSKAISILLREKAVTEP